MFDLMKLYYINLYEDMLHWHQNLFQFLLCK